MKKQLISLCILLVSIDAVCQFTVNAGPQLMIPISTSKATNVGVGAALSLGYEFKNIGVRGNIVYNPYRGKVFTEEFLSITTVRGGIQGFVIPDKVFLFGEAGVALFSSENTNTDTSGFTFGLGAGYRYKLKKGMYLQPSLTFNRYAFDDQRVYTWWNAGFSFGFKKGAAKTLKSDSKLGG